MTKRQLTPEPSVFPVPKSVTALFQNLVTAYMGHLRPDSQLIPVDFDASMSLS